MTIDDIGPRGEVARVVGVGQDGLRHFLRFPDGKTGTVTVNNADAGWPVTTTLLVSVDNHWIEVAPDSIWPETTYVATVRLVLEDVTILDVSGSLRKVPTSSSVQARAGNTVEARDDTGVLRVLSPEPIRIFDAPVDESVANAFKVDVSTRDEDFDDFGGQSHIVQRARELVALRLQYASALAKIGTNRVRGVLFTGPPGTGKTLLARIIAAQAGATFYEIQGPSFFSKWYGESEAVLRAIFHDAANQDSSIIFFDEIDSVAPRRGDDSHEASKRVVAQLLTLMDGFKATDNVIVIATTNRPQDIDIALRRPGRFDWEVSFHLPSLADRISILRAQSRRLSTTGDLPIDRMAHDSDGWNAAELASIWVEAGFCAVTDGRESIRAEDCLGGLSRVHELKRGHQRIKGDAP